jgi:SAM-dependent methyltransferase
VSMANETVKGALLNFISMLGTRKLRWKLLPMVKWCFYLCGQDWNAFYRWMLNTQERNTTLDSILKSSGTLQGGEIRRGLYSWAMGDYHIRFMLNYGLEHHHTVLDFGCGYGRTAIPLIRFLQEGKYVGVDLSDKRIALAEEWIAREELSEKAPRLFAAADNAMPYLEDSSVDVIWTYSVFTHIPPKEVRELLVTVWRVLRQGGIFHLNYNRPLAGETDTTPSLKDYYWTKDDLEALITEIGFEFDEADDWRDKMDEKLRKESVMLILRKNSFRGCPR